MCLTAIPAPPAPIGQKNHEQCTCFIVLIGEVSEIPEDFLEPAVAYNRFRT